MPITKCEKRDLLNINASYVEAMGYSIIDGVIGEITGADGNQPEMDLDGAKNKEAMKGCTEMGRLNDHIDIFSKTARIVYDLGGETKVDSLVLRAHYSTYGKNYTIGEFKLYASDDREELFSAENEIAHERGMDHLYFGERNNADWVYDVKGTFCYFGIEILNSNPLDDIIRLGYIGVYSEEFNKRKKYVAEHYDESLIYNLEPKILTRGELFFDNKMYKLNGKTTFSFKLPEPRELAKMWVVTDGEVKISSKGFKLVSTDEIPYGRKQYNLVGVSQAAQSELNVTIKGNCGVDGIGVSSNKYSFKIDTEKVISNDFMGIGANVLPMHLMPESINSGFNEVYWELERARVNKVRPNVVRMWIQPDWIVDNYDDYKNGNYDFDSVKMKSVCKWLDILKEAGSEVEFNFGWKVASYAQDWYSFPESNRRNSAPCELDLFAKCCSETLYELIRNRGYDNIKYLTFYNEADGGVEDPMVGDFSVIGCGRKEYWEKMLLICRDAIDKKGLTHIKMWGCETCTYPDTQRAWIDYFKNVDALDCFTTHRYVYKSSKNIDGVFDRLYREAVKYKPLIMTECGQCNSMEEYLWTYNHVALFCDMVSIGVSGFLLWCLSSVYLTDPCNFLMRNFFDMWDAPQVKGGIDNVREVFYEWAMLCRYIPNHCKSVTSTVTGGSDNARVAAFTDGNDYTVVVELNKSNDAKDREIEIKFDKCINKKFYKHVYKRPNCRNGNAILPPVCNEIMATDTLCDTVNDGYQEVVYTTVAPVPQVCVSANEIKLSKGDKYYFTAEMIDGSGEIGYELAAKTADSFLLNCNIGLITLNDSAKEGDMCAVKVYSKRHPEAYSIVIVKATSDC